MRDDEGVLKDEMMDAQDKKRLQLLVAAAEVPGPVSISTSIMTFPPKQLCLPGLCIGCYYLLLQQDQHQYLSFLHWLPTLKSEE